MKNGSLTPDGVTSGSGRKIWWLGECGHEWEAQVYSRSKQKTGCPYCVNQKVLKGFNDLATTHPELVKEWHPTKNNDLTPKDITVNSNKKAWWQCFKGHEWESIVNNRTKGIGCPYCSGKKH